MKYSALFLLLILSKFTFAQDMHWSQFFSSPVHFNPAKSGDFIGSSRFQLNYRDQWRSVTKPFESFSFCYDTKFEKHPNIGLGIILSNDKAGDGKFKTFDLQIAPSYKKSLARDSSKIISFGAQIGVNHRNFTFPNYYFDEQYNGLEFDPNLPNTEALVTEKRTNLNLGLGTNYQHRLNRRNSLQFGVSAFNLNQPNQGFYGEKIKRDIRVAFIAELESKLSTKLSILPSVLLQKQGTFSEFMAGARAKYIFNNQNKEYKAIYGGLYFRKKDAFYVHAGMDINKWYFGVSYDVNISTLNVASAKKGGLELIARYIIYRFKPKEIQHRVCPVFI